MPRVETQSAAPFLLEGAESHIIRARAIGDEYQIDMFVPSGPAPAEGWPAIFLLDAKGCFATCVEALRRMGRRPDATGVHPMVVVGISSASHDRNNRNRQRDFADGNGGAAAFLSFLLEEVRPLAAGRVALHPRRQTLFGHSLAGFFTLWVLANHPEAFSSYAAISPSIWTDKEGLRRAILAMQAPGRRVMIISGAWEEELPPWQRASPGSDKVKARRTERQMVASAQEFAGLLQEVLGEDRASFRLLPEEDHASIISAAIPRMLRMASLP